MFKVSQIDYIFNVHKAPFTFTICVCNQFPVLEVSRMKEGGGPQKKQNTKVVMDNKK